MALLGAASIGILLPALSFAGSFTAFGPETYKRGTGREVPVVKRFTVLNPGVPYLLRVHNGVSGEFQGVQNAEIAINGTQVLGPHDFSSGGPVMEKPVTLAASNEISVRVRGTPNSGIRVEIVGTDVDLPTITAQASPPPNANGWNNTSVTVTFTCADATSPFSTRPM